MYNVPLPSQRQGKASQSFDVVFFPGGLQETCGIWRPLDYRMWNARWQIRFSPPPFSAAFDLSRQSADGARRGRWRAMNVGRTDLVRSVDPRTDERLARYRAFQDPAANLDSTALKPGGSEQPQTSKNSQLSWPPESVPVDTYAPVQFARACSQDDTRDDAGTQHRTHRVSTMQ
ncbi:hypothetical protein CDD83_6242 [Cordyceps sp. RAO-2017]|nr:hypothetical protein CDD83_6242 [Cordyceps sp. RAO-2017]